MKAKSACCTIDCCSGASINLHFENVQFRAAPYAMGKFMFSRFSSFNFSASLALYGENVCCLMSLNFLFLPPGFGLGSHNSNLENVLPLMTFRNFTAKLSFLHQFLHSCLCRFFLKCATWCQLLYSLMFRKYSSLPTTASSSSSLTLIINFDSHHASNQTYALNFTKSDFWFFGFSSIHVCSLVLN